MIGIRPWPMSKFLWLIKYPKTKLSKFTTQYSLWNLQHAFFRNAKIVWKQKEQVIFFKCLVEDWLIVKTDWSHSESTNHDDYFQWHFQLKSMDTVSFKFHRGKLCRHKQVKETSWKMNLEILWTHACIKFHRESLEWLRLIACWRQPIWIN